jgi:hypothetical protein
VWSTARAELAAEVSASKVQQRLGDGLKQQMQKGLLVDQDQRIQLMRESEHQMEVTDRKQLRLLLVQPAGFFQ